MCNKPKDMRLLSLSSAFFCAPRISNLVLCVANPASAGNPFTRSGAARDGQSPLCHSWSLLHRIAKLVPAGYETSCQRPLSRRCRKRECAKAAPFGDASPCSAGQDSLQALGRHAPSGMRGGIPPSRCWYLVLPPPASRAAGTRHLFPRSFWRVWASRHKMIYQMRSNLGAREN